MNTGILKDVVFIILISKMAILKNTRNKNMGMPGL